MKTHADSDSHPMVCEQPFSDKNTHSADGWRETQISGMCEDCFDETCTDWEDADGQPF